MRLRDFDSFASDNHGLITRDASGLSPDAWRRAIRGGHLEQLHPRVARLPGTPRTFHQRVAAAVLAAGSDAMASHRSAAVLWGLVPVIDCPVDVLLPTRAREATLDGVRVHRPTDDRRLVPHRRESIRCTGLLRTLVDLGAVDRAAVRSAVGKALTDRRVDLNVLESTVAQHSEHGRHGVVALRNAIDAWSIDAKPADSILETAMAKLAERYDLPPLEFHPVIAGWEIDFRVCGTAVLLECDGWTTHGLRRDQFERDRRKDDELQARGWIVLRFTYRAVTSRPADTAARIRANVERWRHLPIPAAA